MAFQRTQPAYQSLKAILGEKTTPVVAWVGAGLSASAGLPSWKRLIEDLLEAGRQKTLTISDAAIKGLLQTAQEKYKSGEYWIGFQLLEQVLGGTSYQSEIRQRLGKGASAPIPPAYKLLWKAGISGLVNLNLDPLAARAYSDVFPGSDLERFSGHQARNLMGVLQRNKKFLANVHGTLEDSTSWVFTSSRLKPLLADPGYRQFINTCLTARTILFIGITADDIAVREHFERLGAAGVTGIEHFWITDRNDASTDSWAESLSIRVIRYQSFSENHQELLECLTELSAAQPGKDVDLTPVAFLGSTTSDSLPPSDELTMLPLEQVRTQLNAKALDILKKQDSDAYAAYARFSDEYDEAIDRAWYVSLTPPKNVLLGYTLIRRVNSGAFGVVYEATAPDGERVALKLLRRDVRMDSGMLQTFRRGVRSMKILQNHAVQGMVGFRDASEIPALVVMEWIDGPDLDELVKSKVITDWHSIIRIARDLGPVNATEAPRPRVPR